MTKKCFLFVSLLVVMSRFGYAEDPQPSVLTNISKKWVVSFENSFWGGNTFSVYGTFSLRSLQYTVCSFNNNLFAVDIKTGHILWNNFQLTKPSSAIAVSSDGTFICIGTTDGYLYCLSTDSGQKKWSVKISDKVSSPTIAGRTVYVGSIDKKLYAIEDGNIIWEFKTKGKILSTPVVHDDVVYVGSWDKNLYAVYASTGVEKWRFKTKGAVLSSPCINNNLIYFGSIDGIFYAVDIKEGYFLWKFKSNELIRSGPKIVDGIVYFNSYCSVYALDAINGEEKWKNKLGKAGVIDDIFIGKNYIYGIYSSFIDYFFALSIKNGDIVDKQTGTSLNATIVDNILLLQGPSRYVEEKPGDRHIYEDLGGFELSEK